MRERGWKKRQTKRRWVKNSAPLLLCSDQIRQNFCKRKYPIQLYADTKKASHHAKLFCKNKKKKGRMPGKTWRFMKKFIEIKLVSDIGLCLKNFFVPLLYFLM